MTQLKYKFYRLADYDFYHENKNIANGNGFIYIKMKWLKGFNVLLH